jgi:hypothetical protein
MGCRRSIRARTASTALTGETFLALMAVTSPVAGVYHNSTASMGHLPPVRFPNGMTGAWFAPCPQRASHPSMLNTRCQRESLRSMLDQIVPPVRLRVKSSP